jgi:hypothetical protein
MTPADAARIARLGLHKCPADLVAEFYRRVT